MYLLENAPCGGPNFPKLFGRPKTFIILFSSTSWVDCYKKSFASSTFLIRIMPKTMKKAKKKSRFRRIAHILFANLQEA